MSLTTLIGVTPATLGASYCFTSFQKLATDIIAGSQFTFQSSVGNSFFNYGDAAPTVDNQIFPWFRTGAGNLNGWYNFNGGDWILAHPTPASSNERRLWIGTEIDLLTYDGGDTNAPNDRNGPMWAVDHDFDGKFPVGPGTLPGFQAVPVPTVIGVGINGGSEGQAVTLTEAQLATHSHPIGTESAGADETEPAEDGQLRVGGGTLHWELNNGAHVGHTRNTGAGAPIDISTLPPYRGAFMIMRTSRIYFRA